MRLTLFYLKTYHTTAVIKTVWYWCTDRPIDQLNRLESPEINPYINGQLISNKGAEIIQKGKNSLFNKCSCNNWMSTDIRLKSVPYRIPLAKITSE